MRIMILSRISLKLLISCGISSIDIVKTQFAIVIQFVGPAQARHEPGTWNPRLLAAALSGRGSRYADKKGGLAQLAKDMLVQGSATQVSPCWSHHFLRFIGRRRGGREVS
jgi:hypothetical protein